MEQTLNARGSFVTEKVLFPGRFVSVEWWAVGGE